MNTTANPVSKPPYDPVLMESLRQDIAASINKGLRSLTREEVKGLSWFCSEEQKMIDAAKSNA